MKQIHFYRLSSLFCTGLTFAGGGVNLCSSPYQKRVYRLLRKCLRHTFCILNLIKPIAILSPKWKILTLIPFYMLITIGHIKSQFSCTPSAYCNLDLRTAIFGDNQIDSIKNYSYAKSPQSSNFKDWELLGDRECILSDACKNTSEALFFNIYFPKNTVYEFYNTCPLPVIFMFHPGGFSDCSNIENTEGIRYMCREFAKRGFVVFNVEYRRGKLLYKGELFTINRTKTIYQQMAVYRAVQDARGAIRSALKMQADGLFANSFSFNVNKVFGAGASAGSGTVLATAFLQTQAMVDAVSPGFKDRLGNINEEYYYAPSNYSLPEFKGILNMWGNFPMPGSIKTEAQATGFFDQNAYIAPVISFQGKTDQIVEFDNRYEQFPPNEDLGDGRGNYDTTSFCLDNGGLISITRSNDGKDLLMIGALTLRNLVKNKGKQTETYLDCDMGHGLDDDPTDCCTSPANRKLPGCTQTCYKTAFGTNNTTSIDVQLYMVQRTAVFFSVPAYQHSY